MCVASALGQTAENNNNKPATDTATAIADTMSRIAPIGTRSEFKTKSADAASNSAIVANDSAPKKKTQLFKSTISTSAKDSTIFSLDGGKVYLYGDAEIQFDDINLTAAYIEADMDQGIVYAEGVADSTGNITGAPVFKQGEEEMKAKTLTYNVNTQRGYIENLYSEQQDGYLHSQLTKKEADNSINILHGKYTTCELEDPHFYLLLTKGKVIPDKAIVSGPAYMVMADIPLPLALPFGYFPIAKKRASGFIMPRVGEERNRGFYLSDGGYYLALNDYFDFMVRGSVYSKGSWNATSTTRYKVRYKFSGNMSFTYAKTVTGEKGLSDYSEGTSYKLTWTHTQDPKFRPNTNFSANVNFSSSEYNKKVSTSSSDYLTNTTSSSISYQMSSILNSPFNASINVLHTQNTRDSSLSLTLPNLSLSMRRIQPFKRKNAVGKQRWYEDIGISYSGSFKNSVKTHIDSLFAPSTKEKFIYGAQHKPTISKSLKVFNFLNVSPGINYTGRWYWKYIEKVFVDSTLNEAKSGPTKQVYDYHYAEVEHNQFKWLHEYGLSVGVNTTLYGMYQYKFGPILALRHVMTPSISYSYKPDFSTDRYGYYRSDPCPAYADDNSKRYSIFKNAVFGVPSKGRTSAFSFSLGNRVEMKVRDLKDTVTQTRKVVIFDALNFSTSYNMLAEQFKWSNISMTGRTKLFNTLNLNFNATGDLYALDDLGKRIDQFEYDVTGKLFRITRASVSTSYRFSSKDIAKKKSEKESAEGGDAKPKVDATHSDGVSDELREYDYFDVPWSLSFNYSLTYTHQGLTQKISQTLSFNGDLSLTPKWKIGLNSGYDFDAKEFTHTSMSISRDLHCWVASVRLVPFGARQSYSFSINVKSAVLQDLKYNKSRSWYDNF